MGGHWWLGAWGVGRRLSCGWWRVGLSLLVLLLVLWRPLLVRVGRVVLLLLVVSRGLLDYR